MGLLEEVMFEQRLAAESQPMAALTRHWKESGFPLSEIRDHSFTILKNHSGAGLRPDCRGRGDPRADAVTS